jgi:hypothetical protein
MWYWHLTTYQSLLLILLCYCCAVVTFSYNIDVHYLFIDFQAAYDSVWRNEIWSEMHKLGFPPKIC